MEKDLEEREVIMVDMKLIEPRIDLMPDRCNLKIAKSTETPE